MAYRTASMDRLSGDTLVLYTDGVIEAENREGEKYSKEHLVNLVRDNPRLGARELITAIHSSVLAFTGSLELQDDFTLVVLRLLPDNAAANGG